MKERIGIYLDDRRIPTEVPPTIDEWVVVQNYEEFKEVLYDYIREYHKVPYLISLDHDLADEHYIHHSQAPIGSQPAYQEYTEKTGAHCAKILTAVCEKNNLQIHKVCVHSQNPVGALNIQTLINGWKKEHGQDQDCFTMKFKHRIRTEEDEEPKETRKEAEPSTQGQGPAANGDIPSLG